ncbi:hypothetical protein BOTCAL_0847g00020 [Botryotinia calthae]|uniref:LysM domain-containing protein n=1 Tax=Botryotinia calthae TaxID=38488 RepID=A0A4Y8CFE1_9HELO|nr:hypothetical protein BOTCAL_0847g00020 [Botryotinia calthae]
MKSIIFTIAVSALFNCVATKFNLYPPVDPALLGKLYNLSTECIQALNETLPDCDPTLFQMTVSFDNYYWEDDNITTVCDGNCTIEARDWDLDVSLACADESSWTNKPLTTNMFLSGDLVSICIAMWRRLGYRRSEMSFLALGRGPSIVRGPRVLLVVKVGWLHDLTGSVNSAPALRLVVYQQFLLSNEPFQLLTRGIIEWINSYGKLIPADSISGRFVDGISTVCLGSTTDDRWCLGAVQNYTGSDVIQPDCTVNPTDPSCTSNDTVPEYTRMANLYTDDVLCDNCFIQMLYARVTSPYLADSDHSDFLVDQLLDIGDICNVTIPDITVRGLPSYAGAPPPTSVNIGTTRAATTSAPTSTTCAGQLFGPASGCQALSTKYGVTTGDLQTISGSDTCAISGSLCFPKACSLQAVPSGASCDSFASSLPGNVTTVQLLNWNPNIQGLCDSLTAGQMVCVAAPGVNGTYTLAPPPLGTGADAGNQQRGGDGGRVTPCVTYANVAATAAPGPTQTGITSACNAYATADNGIGCVDFAFQNCISATQLFAWNNVLGANGENCLSLFWAKEYYCVNVQTTSTTASPITSQTSTSVAQVTAPGPTQSGIVSNCNKYDTPTGGIGCYDFATEHNITPAQLYAWNPSLGANGANCGTLFWAQEYYCVGVSS